MWCQGCQCHPRPTDCGLGWVQHNADASESWCALKNVWIVGLFLELTQLKLKPLPTFLLLFRMKPTTQHPWPCSTAWHPSPHPAEQWRYPEFDWKCLSCAPIWGASSFLLTSTPWGMTPYIVAVENNFSFFFHPLYVSLLQKNLSMTHTGAGAVHGKNHCEIQ